MRFQCSKPFDLNGDFILRQLVQQSFFMPPIIALAPEVDSITNQLERHTVVLAPIFIGQVGGKASEVEFTMK